MNTGRTVVSWPSVKLQAMPERHVKPVSSVKRASAKALSAQNPAASGEEKTTGSIQHAQVGAKHTAAACSTHVLEATKSTRDKLRVAPVRSLVRT